MHRDIGTVRGGLEGVADAVRAAESDDLELPAMRQ
jgi:hypothetical protein